MKADVGAEIKALRKLGKALTNGEINQLVNDYKAILDARTAAEVAEYNLRLRSNANGLTDAQVAHLAGLVGRLTTLLYYEPGGPVDLETYLATLPEPTAVKPGQYVL